MKKDKRELSKKKRTEIILFVITFLVAKSIFYNWDQFIAGFFGM